ncbi:hypothetical protein VNO77_26867 [Canavalia gladiata]|uniref:Uncharacterized protein n=1 Tax=Canavalia gladiata TaxID=3824 RepID=A0AAN9KT45_CANGL
MPIFWFQIAGETLSHATMSQLSLSFGLSCLAVMLFCVKDSRGVRSDALKLDLPLRIQLLILLFELHIGLQRVIPNLARVCPSQLSCNACWFLHHNQAMLRAIVYGPKYRCPLTKWA